MTKIDIISGFLGAGKTTLINRLIKEAYTGEKVVLIENEFGEIGIDGGFLKDAGIEISEMNSGCICCSLVGDFSKALQKVVDDYAPDRILIEPSGVGKLSDVTKAVIDANIEGTVLNSSVVVVDVNKCKMYMKNFGEFFNNQISNAGCILFSHTDKTTEAKLSEALALVREKNADAAIITTPSDKLEISLLLAAMEKRSTLEADINELMAEDECPVCHHHHHHEEECECGCHDHHHHDEHEHHHHDEHEHHNHDEHDHHHHDEHDHHHHHHHHHHHADEVFTSWGRETVKKYNKDEIAHILKELENTDKYGMVLRAKGMVECPCGKWIYFDYIPEEPDIRTGNPASIGKICVIGSNINEEAISSLFGV